MSDEKTQGSEKPKLVVVPNPILATRRAIVPHDEAARATWPTLVSLLMPSYDAHQRLTREPGSLSIRAEGGVWRVTVQCPTESVQASLGVPSLATVFDALEHYVNSAGCNWTENYESLKKAKQRLKDMLSS